MKKILTHTPGFGRVALIVLLTLMAGRSISAGAQAEFTIMVAKKASELETIASHEMRRDMYLRMGKAVPISTDVLPEIGVRIYPHGDVIPSQKIPLVIPAINETGVPLFDIR